MQQQRHKNSEQEKAEIKKTASALIAVQNQST